MSSTLAEKSFKLTVTRQTGSSKFAADLMEREGGPDRCEKPFKPDMNVTGDYRGTGNGHAVGELYADILRRIMGADMAAISVEYDRAAQLEMPCGVTGHGHGDADRFWMNLRAAPPYAQFEIHHQMSLDVATSY